MRRKDGQSNTSAEGLSESSIKDAQPRRDLPARRFRFSWGDGVVIGAVIVLCGLLLLSSWIYGKTVRSRSRVVRITMDGQVILEREMADFTEPMEYRITSADGEMVIYLSSEKVYVKESSCPDKICMHTGELTKIGEGAVCLPNRVVVQIISGNGETDDPDAKVDVVAR
ncbi:MAG: NusG domain II-containing protein [Clostridiales bacterium]|nr:NusG domain II-containing protein [Clostridiales bacterium]